MHLNGVFPTCILVPLIRLGCQLYNCGQCAGAAYGTCQAAAVRCLDRWCQNTMHVVAQLQQPMSVHVRSEKKTKSEFWACYEISASTCLLVCLSFAIGSSLVGT